MVVVLGIEPRIEESKSSVLPLHYTTMLVPLVGLEPLTFWLTARRSTIELPRNTIPLYMVGIEPTVSVRSGRCFTCKIIYSYCVVYTVRHPWNDKPLTTVYKCRMVTRGGIEPTEHFCSTVFKTVALNQTLPTFHVSRLRKQRTSVLSLTASQPIPTTTLATCDGFNGGDYWN